MADTAQDAGTGPGTAEQARAREAARLREDGFRALAENVPDLVARFDAAGRHLYANPALLGATGHSLEEVLGKTPVELTGAGSPELRQALLDAVRGTARDGKTRSFEATMQLPGADSTFDLRFLPERDPSGTVTSVLGIGRDITPRREVERRLRESEERLRSTLELCQVGTWDWDVKNDGWVPSRTYYTMLGYEPKEGPGDRQEWIDRVHPDDRARVSGKIAEGISGGVDEYQYEARLRHADGSYRWQLVHGFGIQRDAQGKVTRILGVRIDVDERKRAEEELQLHREHLEELVAHRTAALEAANRELESFSYSVSHDLRAPLRAIDGFSALLVAQHGEALGDEARRLIQVVRGSAIRMAQLIDDLLAFTRAGRARLQTEDADMARLAREAWAELEPMRAGRQIDFELGPLAHASGDGPMLRQVWQNLLANAIKFTRPRATARIQVGGSEEGGSCTYYVKDNGVGFDPAYAHKLFDVFQRLHRAEEFEGTGIGLALVKRIITRHGGQVSVEGRAGEGATIRFSLPGRKG